MSETPDARRRAIELFDPEAARAAAERHAGLASSFPPPAGAFNPTAAASPVEAPKCAHLSTRHETVCIASTATGTSMPPIHREFCKDCGMIRTQGTDWRPNPPVPSGVGLTYVVLPQPS